MPKEEALSHAAFTPLRSDPHCLQCTRAATGRNFSALIKQQLQLNMGFAKPHSAPSIPCFNTCPQSIQACCTIVQAHTAHIQMRRKPCFNPSMLPERRCASSRPRTSLLSHPLPAMMINSSGYLLSQATVL